MLFLAALVMDLGWVFPNDGNLYYELEVHHGVSDRVGGGLEKFHIWVTSFMNNP